MNRQSKNNNLLLEIRDIISESRNYVSRSVNYAQIISNWLVGRMIVEDEQKGKKSAEYGKEIIKYLAENLIQEFGNGYSTTNLKYFRQFYLEYPIGHSLPDQLNKSISHSLPDQNTNKQKQHAVSIKKKHLLTETIQQLNNEGNHPLAKILKLNLSWTHHRILLKVENENAKQFYLSESHENNWSTRALDRQINSLYFERILSSQDKNIVRIEAKEKTDALKPQDILKDPMVLEFLQLKKDRTYLESELEKALLNNINEFLLELGKGFAFVARQKYIRTRTKDYFIDLVFYNYLLKCFVLIDLKTRELEHGDIGQMEMYVGYYEDKIKAKDDNPTIGIIMATEKDETIVKYSILNKSEQLFASKYKLFLPSEEELKNEIEQSKLIYKLKY